MKDSSKPVARPLPARVARYLLIALAGFLVLCGAAAVVVPLLVEHVALPRAGDYLGRPISVERVRFNPFTLSLSAQGLRVSDLDPAREFVTIGSLHGDLSVASLRHLAPVIESLRITAPRISLQRVAQRRFNFSDIVDRIAAAPAQTDPQEGTARFALNGFEITGGEIALDDDVLQERHRITQLKVAIPSVSNLDQATPMPVQPAVSATVNGSPFTLIGRTFPFSETRETALAVMLENADIATYLRLSPVPLGFTVPKGRLSARLAMDFARDAGGSHLSITGTSRVDDLQFDARDGPRLLEARRIALELDRVEPFAGRYAFGALDVEGLDVAIERSADGGWPITRAFTADSRGEDGPGSGAEAASGAALAAGDGASAAGSDGAPGAGGEPVHWSIRRTALRDGRVLFTDRGVSPMVRLAHSGIRIELAEIGNRQAAPAAGSLSLQQNGSSSLSWEGELDLAKSRAAGRLEATVAGIAPYLSYLEGPLQAGLATGRLAAQGGVDVGWDNALTLEVADAQASVERAALRLREGQEPAIAFGHLAAEGIALSLSGRKAMISRLTLREADIKVEREAGGRLNLQRIVAPAGESDDAKAAGRQRSEATKADEPGSAGPTRSDEPATAEPTNAEPWSLMVERIDLERNGLSWRDLTSPAPVTLPLTLISGSIGKVGTDLSLASTLDLNARVGPSADLSARGDFVVAPLSLRFAVQLQRFALPAIDPYVASRLALGIEEGWLSTGGDLRVERERVGYRGRLEVDGLRGRERETARDTIRWGKLLLNEIDVEVGLASLGPDDHIAIGSITLSDFFARVLLSEQGRFNLQDIVRTEASLQAQARAAGQSAPGTELTGPAPAPGADEGVPAAPADAPSAARSTASPAPRAPAEPGPAIRIGGIKLERGRSNFTDRFVRPNYSVNLTDLNGGLSAMASDNPAPADVRLAGRVDGDAPIDISGKINPLGATLYAEIRGQAKGIDLPTLTPYSAKYAGYAIEKGKLSLDVNYRIENEQLQAQNRVLLDQLTFGEKIESPDATSLPIQFAVGLLKNSRGEIDVSLPISGSLNDPQFSIRGIIGNAIGNLLTRVIKAPFAALASAFGGGGGEELSFVSFKPGTAELAGDSLERLGNLSKALAQRPALKLEVAGRVDPKLEADAIGQQTLQARLRALKRRQVRAASQAEPESARVTISAEEYPALLQQLYEDTDLPDKPRDSLGQPKPLATADMEKLLLDAIAVDAEAVRRLATRRAQAAREWLATQGKVAPDRIFMLAPRTRADVTGPNQGKPQCAASCVEFSLR